MCQDNQIKLKIYHAVVEHSSVLLAFIHGEPTLPERLALPQGIKRDHKERLEKMEKEITKLADTV